MDDAFLHATLFNLGLNVLHAPVALILGILGLKFIDRHLLRNLDIELELQKGNQAVAIFAPAILLFVGLVLAFGLRG